MPIEIKPNCIIIGAAKAGTTYMLNLLSQHPDICRSVAKELTFFTNDNNFFDSKKFLKEQYPTYSNEKFILDNTPEYLLKSYCAERIYEFSGDETKFICMVRQPAKRAFSHYMMMKLIGREDDSFANAINDEINGNMHGRPTYMPYKRVDRDYVKRGLYMDSLSDFLKYIPKENINIVVFEEFIKNPSASLVEITNFLGIDSNFCFNFNKPTNPSVNARPTILTRPVHAIIYLLKKYGINIKHKTNYTLRRLTSKTLHGPAEKISSEDYRYLSDFYMNSINHLEKEFSLNLSEWKRPMP